MMWRLNTSTYMRRILVACVLNVCSPPSMYFTLYLRRDPTGTCENLNAMKHSTELCILKGHRKTFLISL